MVPGHKTELPEAQAPLFLPFSWKYTESTSSFLSHGDIPVGEVPPWPDVLMTVFSGLLTTSMIVTDPSSDSNTPTIPNLHVFADPDPEVAEKIEPMIGLGTAGAQREGITKF